MQELLSSPVFHVYVESTIALTLNLLNQRWCPTTKDDLRDAQSLHQSFLRLPPTSILLLSLSLTKV